MLRPRGRSRYCRRAPGRRAASRPIETAMVTNASRHLTHVASVRPDSDPWSRDLRRVHGRPVRRRTPNLEISYIAYGAGSIFGGSMPA